MAGCRMHFALPLCSYCAARGGLLLVYPTRLAMMASLFLVAVAQGTYFSTTLFVVIAHGMEGYHVFIPDKTL
jgi:hypothetical protein